MNRPTELGTVNKLDKSFNPLILIEYDLNYTNKLNPVNKQ